MKVVSSCPRQTLQWGRRLAQHLKSGDIICLSGDLGAGKTTFIKGIAKGLGIHPQKVHSPTFVLLNIYEGRYPLFHFDFYRLNSIHQIAAMGYEEFIYGEGVAVIEWAQRFGTLMPKEHLSIKLTFKKEQERFITISAQGSRYRKLVSQITK